MHMHDVKIYQYKSNTNSAADFGGLYMFLCTFIVKSPLQVCGFVDRFSCWAEIICNRLLQLLSSVEVN